MIYKVWHARVRKTYPFQGYLDIDIIVIAKTKEVAHILAVHQYERTSPSEWDIEEISTENQGVYHISQSEN
jgi:hypothetical protein